ncbi:MAG: hypothetical protein V4479_00145 [Actinomycetota bacterium]
MTEPTALLPLRWGTYRLRYPLALALLIAGSLVALATSVYAVYFLGIGIAAHLAGWTVLPARGNRRVLVAVPSAICAAAPLIGSLGSVLAAICLLCWLWTRERPAIAYLVLLFPIVAGVILAQLYPQFGDGGIVAAVTLAVLVGSAWLASWIARQRSSGTKRTSSPNG